MIVYADAGVAYAQSLLQKIKVAVLDPFITLLLAAATLYFIYGVFTMVRGAEDSEARETGRRHMIAGLVGIVVMLSAAALLKIALNTVGVSAPAGL